AASSFASAVVREPLNRIPYECPLPPETGVWLLSPRRVVEALIHAYDLPASEWGWNRVVNLPGITVTVAEMIAAMGKIAGSEVAKRVSWKPDARIEAIVKTWPVRFATRSEERRVGKECRARGGREEEKERKKKVVESRRL